MVLVGLAMVFAMEERELAKNARPIISVRDVVDLIAWHFEQARMRAEVEEVIRTCHRRREQAMRIKRREDARARSDLIT